MTPLSRERSLFFAIIIQRHASAHRQQQQCADGFDRLYREGATRARIVVIVNHPFTVSQPHRIKHLEANDDCGHGHAGGVHWNGTAILDWHPGETRCPEHSTDAS
jgi:hypothetical protein